MAVTLFPVLLFLPATPLKYCTTTSTLFQSFWTSPSARSLTDQQRYQATVNQQISDGDSWWIPVTNDYNGFLSVLGFWNMRNVESGIQHPVLKHKQTIDVISNLLNHVSISYFNMFQLPILGNLPRKPWPFLLESKKPKSQAITHLSSVQRCQLLHLWKFQAMVSCSKDCFLYTVYNAIQIHANVIDMILWTTCRKPWPKHLWAHWRAFARRRSRPGSMGRRLAMCTWDRPHRVQMQIQ